MENTNSEIIPNAATSPTLAVVEKPKTEGKLTTSNIEQKGEACGKPRFVIDSKSVINDQSGFSKKLLCDGLTFTAGQACAYSCTFCYVESALKRLKHLNQLKTERNLKFENMVVEIKDAAVKVRKHLTVDGKPKFADPHGRNFLLSFKQGSDLRNFLTPVLGTEFFKKNSAKKIDLEKQLVGLQGMVTLSHFTGEGFDKPMVMVEGFEPMAVVDMN